MIRILLATITLFSSISNALSLDSCPLDTASQLDTYEEHVFGGLPDDSPIYIRRAYVLAYNTTMLTPHWAAWRVIPEYRDTPERRSRWNSFRVDPDQPKVKPSDYIGWGDIIRGHLVPYSVSGGDRDYDGLDAEIESHKNLIVEDLYDACTVYEVNSMLNVAPQFHKTFNGRPGVWWVLEDRVRKLVDNGRSFNVFAGTIFLKDKKVNLIGNKNESIEKYDIGIPHGFFKIIIDIEKLEAIAFLFDHQADIPQGCNHGLKKIKPASCIVPISQIEQITGLTFFSLLNESANHQLRSFSKKANWVKWLNSIK